MGVEARGLRGLEAHPPPTRLEASAMEPIRKYAEASTTVPDWAKDLLGWKKPRAGWLAGWLSVCLSDWSQLVKASAAFAHSLQELSPTPDAWNTTNGHYWQTWYSKSRAGSGIF